MTLETPDLMPITYGHRLNEHQRLTETLLCVVSLFIMSNQIAAAVLWFITRLQLQVIRNVIDNRKSN